VTGGTTLYAIVGDGKGVFSAADFAFLLKPAYWLSFAVYFLLGYLLLASAIAGLGALTSSLRDAQNLMFPVQMVLMIPLLSIVPIARNPDGPLAQVLTWIPPFTPFIMMNRAAQPPDVSVYAGTTVLLLVSIWGTWRLSARLFRTGMLMSGGSPRLRDLPALLRRP
jgi:ABC-2 type transport system permease protein